MAITKSATVHSDLLKKCVNSHHDLVLGLLLGDQTARDEKVLDLHPLISLELEDPSEICALGGGGRRWRRLVIRVISRGDDVSVACEFLLHSLEQLLGVVLVRETLDGSECLFTISLLKTCARQRGVSRTDWRKFGCGADRWRVGW